MSNSTQTSIRPLNAKDLVTILSTPRSEEYWKIFSNLFWKNIIDNHNKKVEEIKRWNEASDRSKLTRPDDSKTFWERLDQAKAVSDSSGLWVLSSNISQELADELYDYYNNTLKYNQGLLPNYITPDNSSVVKTVSKPKSPTNTSDNSPVVETALESESSIITPNDSRVDTSVSNSESPTITPGNSFVDTPLPKPVNFSDMFSEFGDLYIGEKPNFKTKGSDWLVHLLNRFSSVRANNRIAANKKKLKVPLEIAPQKHAVITDAYSLRLLLEKQKQEMLARANNILTSNIDLKMAIMNLAQQTAEQYEDKQSQLKSQEYVQTSENLNNTDNWNLIKRAEKYNHNEKALSAGYNNWLNAENQRIISNAQADKSFLYDWYTDAGKKLEHDRLVLAEEYIAELTREYQSQYDAIDTKTQFLTDVANWPLLSDYVSQLTTNAKNIFNNDNELNIINRWAGSPDKLTLGLKEDVQFRNLLLSKLKTSSDDVSKMYRSLLEDYIQRINLASESKKRSIFAQYISNRNFPPIDNLYFKKGGKLDILKERIRLNQKEKDSRRESSLKYHERASKELARQLEALDKEQLMLLKAIFK